MICNVLSEEVKDIFISDCADTTELLADFKFSFRYKARRRKIINLYSKRTRPEKENLPRRVKLAVVISIVAFAVLIAGFVTYTYISGFYVDEHKEYAMLTTDECDECTTIEEKFYLDMDLSDYEVEVLVDSQENYTVVYCKEKQTIVVSQIPLGLLGDIRVDTEDAIIDINEMEVIEKGISCRSRNGEYHFFCKFDKYVMEYNCIVSDISEELLVKSTKFK